MNILKKNFNFLVFSSWFILFCLSLGKNKELLKISAAGISLVAAIAIGILIFRNRNKIKHSYLRGIVDVLGILIPIIFLVCNYFVIVLSGLE